MDHHGREISERWQTASATVVAIKQLGDLKGYVKLQGLDLVPAFEEGDGGLRCIDGRTPGGVHLAGSGILMGDTWDLSLALAEGTAGQMGVKFVTYHPDCGAAAAFAKAHPELGMSGDEAGRKFATKLAERLGVPAREQELIGSSGFHHESAIYYDGTGTFDPKRVEELPAGFVISRRYLDSGYALKEAKMAIGIALGAHGFGERFDRDHPLLLVAIGGRDGEFATSKLLVELGSIAGEFGDRVMIDRIVKP
jgi:hypothetical protein